MQYLPRRDRGFTLVEIVIAIVLVGVLSAVVVVGVGSMTSKGTTAACTASADAALASSAAHLASTGTSPASFADLVGSGTLQLPSGVSVDAGGRRLVGPGWQLVMSSLGSPSFVCGSGTQLMPIDASRLPSAAFSTRLLSAAYAGPALRVRRSSDNTTADIGFTAAGDLDVAALTAFVGAGDGAVTTWYDQTGAGRHAVQTTTANQPLIVVAGTVQSVNGRPAPVFDGNDLLVSANAAAWTRTGVDVTSSVVLRRTGGTGNQGVIGTGGGCAFSYVDLISTPTMRVMTWTAVGMRDVNGGAGSDPTTGLRAIAATATSTSLTVWADGVHVATANGATASGAAAAGTGLLIGNRATGCSNGFIGPIAEVITYKDASLTTAESRALQVGQGSWFGITIS